MKMRFLLYSLTVVLLLPFGAEAGVLQKVLDKYSKANTIFTEIIKTDEKIVLGTKTVASGVMKLQKNKIYIAHNGEKKVELFYADKVLILVEYPDADFEKNGARKVTTLKKSIPPLIHSLLGLFSDSKNFKREFSVVSEKTNDGLTTIDLKPKQKSLKNLTLVINPKTNQVTTLSFVDDVDTKTTIEFNNTKLNTKISKADFQFTKLKSDEEMFE